jgi:uncharacterized membrane protein
MRYVRQQAEETDRLPALSDGVIAIVITLLVLDIAVPPVSAGTPLAGFRELLFQQATEFFGFVMSFLVIGLYWTLHRRMFVHIETHGRGVVSLNLLFLLSIAFLPYATSVFTTHPNRFGVTFFSGAMALCGLSLAILWGYASRHEFLAEGFASRAVQLEAARYLAIPLVFLLAVLVAVVSVTGAVVTWLLLFPIHGALESRFVTSVEKQ